MDPDTEPAPILIKALSTYNEIRIESGPHPVGPPRRILAKALWQWLHSQLPPDGPFAKYHATLSNREDLAQRSVNLLVARKTKKGDKFLLRIHQPCQHGTKHSRCSPIVSDNNRMAKSFTMQLLPAQKPVTSPVEPAVTPTSRDGVASRETPRNSESQISLKSFFSSSQRQWEHRDSGAHEPECPQVCATGRLERPLQCVVVILRLAARRIMLVPHEWTLSYSRGIVVVVDVCDRWKTRSKTNSP